MCLGCEDGGAVKARFSHIAGDRALDLVNTVEWRLSETEREEDLTDYRDILDWCLESGLLTTGEAAGLGAVSEEAATTERSHVLALREALYQALFQSDPGARRVINAELHEALAAADYVPASDGWRWHDHKVTGATPRHRIARAIMSLLARDDLDRLHQCEDAQCGWVFLDTSRAHNRRWCVTKDCGDRNRSRAYYARQKATS